jgi:hypothetical protein
VSGHDAPSLKDFPKPTQDQIYALLRKAMIRRQELLMREAEDFAREETDVRD